MATLEIITRNQVTTTIDDSTDVPTSEAVKDYVDTQIAANITDVLETSY